MEALSSQPCSSTKPPMSSEFMARRRVYEGDDAKTFQAAVTVLARGSSSKKASETTSDVPVPERLPTPTRIPSPTTDKTSAALTLSCSDKGRKVKIVGDARPVVPKRTSSINLSQRKQQRNSRHDLLTLQRHSGQPLSSLNSTVVKNKTSSDSLNSSCSQTTAEKQSSDFSSNSFSGTSSVSSPTGSPVLYEESPLAFTLSRKRTSLPPIDNAPAFRQRAYEGKSLRRESQIAKRESVVSIRDRASFLSSFPQPPKSPSPKTSLDHKRLTSASRYILFPRTEPQREMHYGSKPSSPTHSNAFVLSRPTTAQETRTPAGLSIDLRRSASVRSQSHPDITLDTNLDLALSYQSRFASRLDRSNALTSQPISWKTHENVGVDQNEHGIRGMARRIAPRKMFGSLGGDKNRLSLCFSQNEGSLDDSDDDDNDDDDKQRNSTERKRKREMHAPYESAPLVGTCDGNAPQAGDTSGMISTGVDQLEAKLNSRKKSSGLFGLKAKTSSASNLLTEANEKETYEQRWEREVGSKRSIWKRMLCF